jgi:hypothetical protein
MVSTPVTSANPGPPGSPSAKRPAVRCADCRHFRAAPYETRFTGCYHEKHVESKQKDRFLDEQQLPGDHLQINRRGDCPEHEPRPRATGLWRWLFR